MASPGRGRILTPGTRFLVLSGRESSSLGVCEAGVGSGPMNILQSWVQFRTPHLSWGQWVPCQAEPDSTPTLGLPALKGTREAASRTGAEANPWSKGGRRRLVGWAWHGSGAQATETSPARQGTGGGALAGWGQGVRKCDGRQRRAERPGFQPGPCSWPATCQQPIPLLSKRPQFSYL